jgi:hypothetical protein
MKNMRSIAIGFIAISVLTAVVDTAQTQQRAPAAHPGQDRMAYPVGHRQPARVDITQTDQVKSEESGSAKAIEQEDERIDRLIRGICRGC